MKIAIIEKNGLLLEALRIVFKNDEALLFPELAGYYDLLIEADPEAILLDAALEGEIARLRAYFPKAAIIVSANRPSNAQRERTRDAGASAYVDKMHIARFREIVEDISARASIPPTH